MRNAFVNAVALCKMLTMVTGDQAEYRLHKDLMENYSPLVRPVKDFSDTLQVKMKVILQQIVGLVSDANVNYIFSGREESGD